MDRAIVDKQRSEGLQIFNWKSRSFGLTHNWQIAKVSLAASEVENSFVIKNNLAKEIEIRECTTLEELATCVDLQREVFALPEIELSPVRHFVVTKNAGGFILGAWSDTELVGFVLSVPAFLRDEKAFYSHMTAVRADFQSQGVGGQLKWAAARPGLAAWRQIRQMDI